MFENFNLALTFKILKNAHFTDILLSRFTVNLVIVYLIRNFEIGPVKTLVTPNRCKEETIVYFHEVAEELKNFLGEILLVYFC